MWDVGATMDTPPRGRRYPGWQSKGALWDQYQKPSGPSKEPLGFLKAGQPFHSPPNPCPSWTNTMLGADPPLASQTSEAAD